MRFKVKDIKDFKNILDQVNNISIITHYNPDGDAVGSSVALFHYLKDLNKNPVCIIPNPLPKNISFVLKDVNYIIAERDFKTAKYTISQSDLLLIVDMNTNSRSGENLEKVIKETSCKKVLIDHHVKPDKFDVNFSFSDSSSSCEVVYNLLVRMTGKKVFSSVISTALYLGVITDTGSVSYSNDSPEVYMVLSNLLKSGIKASKLHQQIFDTYSFDRLRLLGYAISHKMRVFYKQRAAFIYLSKKELANYNYKIGDLEGVVNYCLKLEGVDFCAMITEREDKIRMSFRSKDAAIDVNVFARKYWNGGGHVMASGGKSYDSLEKVVETFTKQIYNQDFMPHE
ncbi:MAG: DHH family phosphoesterase [Bacteroidota bacterium]|nr:DHH family phosphoesterase [Bacteroidota bacterium]